MTAQGKHGESDWIDVRTALPPLDEVVECAAISGYDGSLYRAFMARWDGGEGWLWSQCRGWSLTEATDDDDYCVAFWRKPTALPDVRFPDVRHNGRPTPYAEVNDPPEKAEA